MIIGIVILLASDVLIVGLSRLLRLIPGFEEPEDTPLVYALLACFGALFAHTIASIPLALQCDWSTGAGRLWYFVPYVLQGMIPVAYYLNLFSEILSDSIAYALYGMGISQHSSSSYSDADALFREGDTGGALELLRARFLEDATNPEPLFYAAQTLNNHGKYCEAAEWLREITLRFNETSHIWTRAAFYLAELSNRHLDDALTAGALMREIISRAPRSQYASLARKWIAARKRPRATAP